MENFIVSARKYRPDTFESVVGQGSITHTLKNAIRSKHLAQAYLFCGPRGVGKTTCARIFAKTLNCQSLSSDIEACNSCESCNSFIQSRSYNIHELDAASNNSVEDIRNLIDQVRIPPQIGKYSIYIIDEVHMLSQAAFNAFLKTLEEPPAHAVFILATTEKHKIIPTILSRCQIFDFNRIKVNDITEYLEKIAKAENVEAETEALNIIAQKADGAMRDALSIFDQVVSFSENQVTYKKVIENLNVLDYEYYFDLIDAFLANDLTTSLLKFNEILDNGFDGHQFINGLSAHARDLLVCKDTNTLQLLEVGDSIKNKYLQQAEKCSREFLYNTLAITSDCDVNYKISNNKRLHVELTLVKLSNITAVKKKADIETEIEVKQEVDNNKNESSKKPEVQEKTDSTPPVAKVSSSSLSIKSALNSASTPKQENKKVEEVKNDEPEIINEFSKEELIEKWTAFSQSIQSNEPRLFSTLTSSKPGLKENFTVEFTVSNELQKESILEIQNKILHFLKRELKNTAIKLELIIETVQEEQKLYTHEDKFKHMADKNDSLNTLKQKLNLDFD